MIKNSFSYGKIRNIVLVGDASLKHQQWRKKILQRFILEVTRYKVTNFVDMSSQVTLR
jgi:hypothetical protein